jgi:hypothetical protein
MSDHTPTLEPLRSLLRERLSIIADHAFRDRDSASHLAALQTVSERIESEYVRLKAGLPPRLNHFLAQASYQKALDYLEQGEG